VGHCPECAYLSAVITTKRPFDFMIYIFVVEGETESRNGKVGVVEF
jgi:hypothetical protein